MLSLTRTRIAIFRIFCFALLGMLLSTVLSAQENFEGWLSGDQMLISRNEGSKINRYQIILPEGRRKEWKGDGKTGTGRYNPLMLNDGSLIQMQKGDMFLIRPDGAEQQLTFDEAEEKNARLSADKSKIAYTKANDLYIIDLVTYEERRLTHDGSETVYNGWASWVYYEEILGRSSRYAAFWWSPDSRKIAFLRFDDSPVPTFPIFRASGQHGELEVMHYPKPGDPNPDVRFGVADVENGIVVWISEDRSKDQYSAHPFWTPDSKYLLIQEMNRGQDTLQIIRTNPQDGSRKMIYQETQPGWVDFFEEMYFIDERDFVIRSTRNGWYNLYRCDIEGKEITNLTPVSWRVLQVDRIDRQRREIYFYGTGPLPTDRHYFSIDFSGEQIHQITSASGWHHVKPSPDFNYFLDEYSSLEFPVRSRVIDPRGEVVYSLDQEKENPNDRSGVIVESFNIQTDDGFNLPGFWILPKGFDRQKKYPVVFTVYGGPERENVLNRFQDFSGDFYANNGIIRIELDHRGSGKFGKRGLDYLHRNLGKWEIDDLITAVKYLRTLSFIDSNRIGITGGSYGGYVTCLALTYGADYFTHGVSLYPVTDWLLYDNVYTERFMDTPAENPEGYRFGSAIEHVSAYKGRLLIVHGTMDDNVHFQHTLQFISKMQDMGKDFQMMVYPGERHGWGGPKRMHLSRTINNFWKKNLLDAALNRNPEP